MLAGLLPHGIFELPALILGISGSPTQVLEMSEFHAERQGEILQGSPEEVVNLAIDRLVKLEML